MQDIIVQNSVQVPKQYVYHFFLLQSFLLIYDTFMYQYDEEYDKLLTCFIRLELPARRPLLP